MLGVLYTCFSIKINDKKVDIFTYKHERHLRAKPSSFSDFPQFFYNFCFFPTFLKTNFMCTVLRFAYCWKGNILAYMTVCDIQVKLSINLDVYC